MSKPPNLATNPAARVCPRCGEQTQGQPFCIGCGLNLEAPPQVRTSRTPLRTLLEFLRLTERCPRCGTLGFRRGKCIRVRCVWKDPILEPSVPSGWYQDPANPAKTRYWDRAGRRWSPSDSDGHGHDAKDVSPSERHNNALGTARIVALSEQDPPAAFRIARIVALIAAVIAGALTAPHWYSFSLEVEKGDGVTLTAGHGLWTAHPAIAALIVAGALFVIATCAASLFRVPNDEPNLPPTVLGFAALAALVALVSSIVGLADTPPSSSFVGESVGIPQVHNTGAGAVTLLSALAAVACTALMFWIGRDRASEALSPSGPEPSRATEPESREPATARQAVIASAATPAPAPRQASDGDPVKRCPECAEWVKDAAQVCRYCGKRFASASNR